MNDAAETPRTNVPELSVSELALGVKRVLEDSFGRIRVRGELSRVNIAGSGHMYSDLKDENAVINVVCWKGTMSKLSIRPEEGLDVVVTGRMTSYPQRSNYQLVIESMELAGEGALLKMLEERKKKLAGEGLFAAERKKKLPFLPQTIGVVTSPTGAVIRDIMHRLNDRFPRHVLVWPVLVQGKGADEQITAAIRGFNAMPAGGAVPRPDLIIVARGGGSLEDLMAFNEENVVRAAAESDIPLISAVGHETDTTLIDYASDMRAPTPTGAAEIAVPRRIDLLAQTRENEQRLTGATDRLLRTLKERTQSVGVRLGDPTRLLEVKTQSLDHVSHKLSTVFDRIIESRRTRVIESGAKLRHPRALIQDKAQKLDYASRSLTAGFDRLLEKRSARLSEQAARLRMPKSLLDEKQRELTMHAAALTRLAPRLTTDKEKELSAATRMLDSLSYENVIKRGYAIIRDENGKAITKAATLNDGQNITIELGDGKKDATIGTGSAKSQQSLF
ncbi:MAG: exodeoxyribonuclease VII large subunit [Pseudomonadota bacterium]|nr:exodeoxyribonuclease VII large subunit [Pseudomonadota bacterium]